MTGKKAYQWKWMLSAAGILLLLFLCAGKVYGAERIRVLVKWGNACRHRKKAGTVVPKGRFLIPAGV